MNNLENKIQEYFEKQEVKEKFDKIVNQKFKDPKKREMFLRVFNLIKKGEYDIFDLDQYLVEEMGMQKDEAFNFNDELFYETYIDIYLEIQDLYNEKHSLTIKKDRISRNEQENLMSEKSLEKNTQQKNIREEKIKVQEEENKFDKQRQENLIEKYNQFIKSSVWQNILAKQEDLEHVYYQEGQIKEKEIKNKFYEAINSGDKITLVAILRLFVEKGILRQMFIKDTRYIDFWAGFLNRHGKDKAGEEFLKDSAKKDFLGHFLKFILEKRVGFLGEEAVMVAVNLGAVCSDKEKEYQAIAYGDETKNNFVWNLKALN